MTQPDPSERSLLTEQHETPTPFVDPGSRSVPVVVRAIISYGVICLLAGLVTGLIWRLVVTRPGYVVNADGGASTTERGLTEFFAADADFTIIGAIAGILLGLVAWFWFGHRGWITVPLAIAGSVLAALVCWQFGVLLAGNTFESTLARAEVGQTVRIDLKLSATSAVWVWALFAVAPVLLISSLSRDEVGPGRRRVRTRRPRAVAQRRPGSAVRPTPTASPTAPPANLAD